MSRKARTAIFTAVYATLLTAALALLVCYALPHKFLSASYAEQPRPLTGATVQIAGGEERPVTLPANFNGLAPRTPVTVKARIEVRPGDSLFIKTIFSPVRLYINGKLAMESGQPGSYPSYMSDPPTLISTLPLTGVEGGAELRVEYLSPSGRATISLPALLVGNEAALLSSQFQSDGASLLFSLILIFFGVGLTFLSLMIVGMDASGVSFLWLGLFSLAAGTWVLGECDLSAFLLPYPVLLYNMSYMGMFLTSIPLLRFGLVILNPKNRRPMQIALCVHYVSTAAVLALQLLGWMDFIRSLYWFHIIAPLAFLVFAGNLLWEHIRHRNPAAKRFAPAVLLLAAATMLELLNYWLHFTGGLTRFFQSGVLAFVVSLTAISGFYVRQSFRTHTEKIRLEQEMAATFRQLALQRLQYCKIAEHNAAVEAQRHDLRHQLAVIRTLNEQGEQEKLRGYLDTLVKKIPSDEGMRICENYAVNAVAAYYLEAANAGGIQTDLQLTIPPTLDQAIESDLCIVVGNLLENAVEACLRMAEGERLIRLNSRLQYGTLTITVDNSFGGSIRKKEDAFLSSKREGAGTGLSSVSAVAKKYGGAARFEVLEGMFQASVYVKLEQTHAPVLFGVS